MNRSVVRIIDTIEPITRVDFSIYGNDDVKKQSVIPGEGITVPEINSGDEPVFGGVSDARLGSIDNNKICLTCSENGLTCPGHFGHITLVEPVFHSGYIDYLKNIMSCICIICHKILVYKTETEIKSMVKHKTGKQRFQDIKALAKRITSCPNCGVPVHKIKKEKGFLTAEVSMKNTETGESSENKNYIRNLTPKFCYAALKTLSDDDCRLLGMDPSKCRPEDMIIYNFPIPPNQVRPTVRTEFFSHDDLTNQALNIVKCNESLKDDRGDGIGNKSKEDDHYLLQSHVSTYINNPANGPHRALLKNKRPIKSVAERLTGKEGRARGNLMGKRVDGSSRSVISSYPDGNINDVRAPMMIATNLTYPQIVTKENYPRMCELVATGPFKYPGATHIIKRKTDDDGNEVIHKYVLKHAKKAIQLEIGDIVERHMMDGDLVLFNRQPSLHKLSMMGHFVKVVTDPTLLTFGLNENVTNPYNADFDGDEMNLHIPRSIQTVIELLLIANAANHFIGPSNSKITITAKQDTLLGSFLLPNDKELIDWKDAMRILMITSKGISPAVPKNKMVTGKYLYSQIISKNINLIKDDGSLKIINGMIYNGSFVSSTIQTILQKSIFLEGNKVAQNFIDDLQRMVLRWLLIRGITVGIIDMVIPKEKTKEIKNYVETKRKEVMTMITKYENDPFTITKETHEVEMRETLAASQKSIQDMTMACLNKSTGMFSTITSGSNGTEMNAGQIVGALGQTIVDSARIHNKFNQRSLPMFHKHDNNPLARGYIASSFIDGLTPSEFIFHVMAGREGTITTAVKTAATGYVERRLIKCLEDVVSSYDGTVRSANDRVIQLVYGDNGISTEKQLNQSISIIRANNESVKKKYIYTDDELSQFKNTKYTKELNHSLYKKLISMRDKIRQLQKQYLIEASDKDNNVFKMPVDLTQIITNIRNSKKETTKADIVDPHYVLKTIKQMYESKEAAIYKISDQSVVKKQDNHTASFVMKLYLYDLLSPKRCTHEYRFSKDDLDYISRTFLRLIVLAKIEGGEMVGFVAAQSIGEPVTQTNLKTFHRSGTGKTVTAGLTRITELLGISKKIKGPEVKIVLDAEHREDQLFAEKIAYAIRQSAFIDIADSVSICFDPNPMEKGSIMMEDEATEVFDSGNSKNGCQSDVSNLHWTIRIVLSRDSMIGRDIDMRDIKVSFCENWMRRGEDAKGAKREQKKILDKITQCGIATSNANSPEPIVHIRFDASVYNYNTFITFQDIILHTFKIKGSNNIVGAEVKDEKYIEYDANGNEERPKRKVIITDGINMKDICQLNGVNMDETVCNDLITVYEMYGIEAARRSFINEFVKAIQSTDGEANYQHVSILADAITYTGTLVAVNRHGSSKLDTDPLSRASYEKTVEQMLSAAVFSETDNVRSVAARIMTGRLINGGTGAFDIHIDHEKLKAYNVTGTKPVAKAPPKKSSIADMVKSRK